MKRESLQLSTNIINKVTSVQMYLLLFIMFKPNIVLVFLASFALVTLGYKIGKKVVKLDRYDACVEPEGSPLTLTYMKIDFSKTIGSYLNGEARLTRHIAKFRLSCNFTRCANRESLDTCEQFTKLEPSDTCMVTKLRNAAWSGVVFGFHPPFNCPLQKGTFHIINASFNGDYLNFLPFDDWYWKAQFDIFELQTLLVSICFEFRVLNV